MRLTRAYLGESPAKLRVIIATIGIVLVAMTPVLGDASRKTVASRPGVIPASIVRGGSDETSQVNHNQTTPADLPLGDMRASGRSR